MNTRIQRSGWRYAGVTMGAVWVLLRLSSPAAAVEAPPTATAESILGPLARGADYSVDPVVESDGFMHEFKLRTAYGTFEVTGDQLVRVRIQELAAVRRLQAMSQSDTYRKAVGQAATAPIRFGVSLVNDPGTTVRGTVSGIANMFDRAGSAVSNIGAGRDNLGGSLLGVDTARRQLAFELGVDPYSDFPPLASALSSMARAAAGGKLTIQALTMAIPGGAGTMVSATSTSTTARELLRDSTSTQIIDVVRKDLKGAGVTPAVVDRLVRNRLYTPTDLLAIGKSIAALRARNATLFVAAAAEAVARDEAYFNRMRAELLARSGPQMGVNEFVSIGGFPLNRTRGGQIVAIYPIDAVSWTDTTANTTETATAAQRGAGGGQPIFAITGTFTPMAQAEIAKLGWRTSRLQ